MRTSLKSTLLFSITSACALSFSGILQADAILPHLQKKKTNRPQVWLTGPLLTPSGHVVPYKHFNIEPYEYIETNYGIYNNHWRPRSTPKFYNLITQVPIQIGLPANFDFNITPQWAWNHTSGASHWVVNDLNWGFDYQLISEKADKWWPAVKLALRANFPIGKYQHLNPSARFTDIGGSGSWSPGVGLTMSRLYWLGGHHYFAPRFNIQYTFPTPVHVRNYNAYGGGRHTSGKVYPGQQLVVQFGFEITMSQRWAFANDIQYQHFNKTRFSGQKGATNGVPNNVGFPSSEQWSLAPALEYNWNTNIGIIAGPWFTFAGRNTLEFAQAVIAFNIYH
ncbi:MAG: hypothetical protein HYX67_08200 [Candidatus Melainabacteria bacterium]|nr:hypothetical protein [Candidatus Melainabacteria bacterium]